MAFLPLEVLFEDCISNCEAGSIIVLFLLLLSDVNVLFYGFIELLSFCLPVIIILLNAVCIILQLLIWVVVVHGFIINRQTGNSSKHCFKWCVPG